MGKSRAWVPFLLACFVSVIPLITAAQGLVPCRGIDCQACSIVDLIQNLINFAIGLSIPIAMGLFAYAGVLYFSSAANPSGIEKAKKIFRSAFIGFIIALGAYLMVETMLHAILNENYFNGWNNIECVGDSERPTDRTIGEVLTQVLGTYKPPTTIITSTIPSCVSGSFNDKKELCINANGNTSMPIYKTTVIKGGLTAQCTNTNCSVGTYMAAGLDQRQANVMSCIAMTENSGNAAGCNGNACGAQQIMITVNKLVGSACSPSGALDCPALCKGNDGAAAQTAKCAPCVKAANNAQCNAQATAALVQENGYKPWVDWSDNSRSAACVQKYGS